MGSLRCSKDFEAAAPDRPDILGGIDRCRRRRHGLRRRTTSSPRQRLAKNESQEMPAELQEAMAKFGELVDGDVEYIDLRQPWLD